MQVAGTAVYTDDIPPVAGELHCGLVLSTRAHAAILSLDPAAALLLPGVVAWLDRNSVRPGGNTFATAITQDELVFAEDTVHCQGQVVGAVVAEDRDTAQRAARLVKVEYRDLPTIITMEQAIAAKSFHHWSNNTIHKGEVDEEMVGTFRLIPILKLRCPTFDCQSSALKQETFQLYC